MDPVFATSRRHTARPGDEHGGGQEDHAEHDSDTRGRHAQGGDQNIAYAEQRKEQRPRTPRHGGTLHRARASGTEKGQQYAVSSARGMTPPFLDFVRFQGEAASFLKRCSGPGGV